MNEAYLTLAGRVITDISQRTLPSGDMVCNFRMVSTERRFNREAQDWEDGDRLFLQVTCWRKLAENVSSSLFKGDAVLVSGRVYLNQYEVNGTPRATVEMEAKAVGPNLAMCAAMIHRPLRTGIPSEPDAVPAVVAA
jgi:single-strand DNA-binding protein